MGAKRQSPLLHDWQYATIAEIGIAQTYSALSATQRTLTHTVPEIGARGRLRAGSMISPASHPTELHPLGVPDVQPQGNRQENTGSLRPASLFYTGDDYDLVTIHSQHPKVLLGSSVAFRLLK